MRKKIVCLILTGVIAAMFFSCTSDPLSENTDTNISIITKPETTEVVTSNTGRQEAVPSDTNKQEAAVNGDQSYRGFVIDNILHSESNGDIHYNIYVPDSYDGSRPYALYVTLPGYEGLYFQGVAQNLKSEEFGFEAQKYNDEMIIIAPQLSDWGETSANQTIDLVEYIFKSYSIDRSKVYANGYSGGGETMSIVLGKRADMFTAYLQVSSKWDGEYEAVAQQRLPIYFAVGKNDEYYGSDPTREAYEILYSLYEKQGLSKEEIDELLVLDIKDHEYFTQRNAPNEHGGGGLLAYDEDIMGWLFSK